MNDAKYKGLRAKLVEELKNKGITDRKVLDAINVIPRHLFLDPVFRDKFAYEDAAFPIGEGQTISQPYTVAYQSELLHVKKGSKVLEIGTGSGYQTAVLCQLGVKVHSIERQKSVCPETSVRKMGTQPRTHAYVSQQRKRKILKDQRFFIHCSTIRSRIAAPS